MSPLELRDRLSLLLVDELGTFGNGKPAIWVQPPDPPQGTVTGLQVIIERVPAGGTYNQSAGQRYQKRYWNVLLTQYDRKRSLSTAKLLIEQTFTQARDPVYIPPSSTSYERCRLCIFDPIVLNPL